MVSGLSASPSSDHLVEAVAAALRGDPKLSVVVVTLNPTGQPSLERSSGCPDWSRSACIISPPGWGSTTSRRRCPESMAVVATTPAGAHLAASLGVAVTAIDTGSGDRFDPAIPVLAGGRSRCASDAARRHPPQWRSTRRSRHSTAPSPSLPSDSRAHRVRAPDRHPLPIPSRSALAILQQRLVDERSRTAGGAVPRPGGARPPPSVARASHRPADPRGIPALAAAPHVIRFPEVGPAGRDRGDAHVQPVGSHQGGAPVARRGHRTALRGGDRRQRFDRRNTRRARAGERRPDPSQPAQSRLRACQQSGRRAGARPATCCCSTATPGSDPGGSSH